MMLFDVGWFLFYSLFLAPCVLGRSLVFLEHQTETRGTQSLDVFASHHFVVQIWLIVGTVPKSSMLTL